jgi:hypothetical protein
MKKLFFLTALLLFWQVPAQQNITSSQWQEDLRFLQHTVHNDYPFLFKKTTATAFDESVGAFYKAIPQMQDHEVTYPYIPI